MTRVPGTNLVFRRHGRDQPILGTVINMQLVSPNAINVPPTIRVYMNYRDSTMRGQIYPIPPSRTRRQPPTKGSAGYRIRSAAQSGLHHELRIQPHRSVRHGEEGVSDADSRGTASAPDGDGPRWQHLYVAETGGETIDIVDLTQMAVTGSITLPPFPRAANAAVVST